VAKLGEMVSDTLTDFRGIVVGRAEFLYGCVRLQVQPNGLKDGKPAEEAWLDEDRVRVETPQEAIAAPASAETRRGGPSSNPTRGADASR
jgi:hypothetical protein